MQRRLDPTPPLLLLEPAPPLLLLAAPPSHASSAAAHCACTLHAPPGENTIMHVSNNLPDIRIALSKPSDLETTLLLVGQVVTLNTVQTKDGWKKVGTGLLALLALQLIIVGKAVLQKRRHLRALDEVKKM